MSALSLQGWVDLICYGSGFIGLLTLCAWEILR